MSPLGLVSSQPAKCQPDSQERPGALIKRLNGRKEGKAEGGEREAQPTSNGKHVSVRSESCCPLS